MNSVRHRFVSQECLDCILEDIRDTPFGEHVQMHPIVLRRMIDELVFLRVDELQSEGAGS